MYNKRHTMRDKNERDTQEEPNATKLISNGIPNFKILFLINIHLSMSYHFRNRQTKALRFVKWDHYISSILQMFWSSKTWHVIILLRTYTIVIYKKDFINHTHTCQNFRHQEDKKLKIMQVFSSTRKISLENYCFCFYMLEFIYFYMFYDFPIF